MKRSFYIGAIMFLLAMVAFKPAQAQEGVKVGFRASPLIGWASVIDDSSKTKPEGLSTKAGIGFSFDFVCTIGFSEAIGFRTGINIATKSFKSEISAVSFTSTTNVTAVEVPVGFKFRSPEIGTGMHIIGHIGLNNELNVQNKMTSTLGSVSTEQRDVDGIRFYTFSFVPGVGLDWEFDWGMLEFAATYHWGLMSLTNPNDFGGAITKMNYIALNLGYFF